MVRTAGESHVLALSWSCRLLADSSDDDISARIPSGTVKASSESGGDNSLQSSDEYLQENETWSGGAWAPSWFDVTSLKHSTTKVVCFKYNDSLVFMCYSVMLTFTIMSRTQSFETCSQMNW